MIEYKEQLKYFNWNIREKKSHKKDGGIIKYVDNILTFDIETTSAWINEHGNVIRYHPGRSSDYWNSLKPLALCYIWQFSVDNDVFYGRELRDYITLLDHLPKDAKIIIWIHNAAFEFGFLQGLLPDLKVFARTPHKPMKFDSAAFPNIEFRCSYMLTRLSLEAWGDSIGVKKLVGDLDYEKIRTPLTPLTSQELGYCERDCIVVYNGIKDYLRRYDTQWDIPLTQTGTVRRVVKNKLLAVEGYQKFIKRLVPYDAKMYKILQNIFAGGYTHANRLHAGVVQEGLIEHFDYCSHYPTMMFLKYPCTPWAYLGQRMPDESTFEDNAYIMHLHFEDLECQTFNTYIQFSKSSVSVCKYARPDCKCKWRDFKLDNGRVIRAKSLDIWVTEQDWLTIKDTYKWRTVRCTALYKSHKDFLPKELIEYILELYGNKTALKNIPEDDPRYDLYKQSKQYINALFGMSVTALMQSDIEFNPATMEWTMQPLTVEAVNQRLKELRAWSPRERRYFMSYSWGCYITAYARRMLWKNLLAAGDKCVLYCDTDSLFLLGHHDFTSYNNWITERLEECCNYHGIDPELTRPKDPDGVAHPLGVFTKESDAVQFLTLGAKRYIERRVDGKLYLTVSGINKSAVHILKDNICNFKDGFEFNKDFPTVKKRLLTYITDQPDIIWPDGYKSTYRTGINLRRTGYKITMTDDYKELIKYESLDLMDMPASFKNHLRGRYYIEE